MAVSSRFDAALRRLLKAFKSYVSGPRSPNSVGELGARRADLEDARLTMTAFRQQEGSRGATPRVSPQWVEPGRGRSATTFEKAMVSAAIVLFMVIVVGGVLLGVYAFRSTHSIDVLELRNRSVVESFHETDTGSCVWSLSFGLVTEQSRGVQIREIWIDTSPRGTAVHQLTPLSPSDPHEIFGQIAYEFKPCPASVDDIKHGGLNVSYTVAGSTDVLAKTLNW